MSGVTPTPVRPPVDALRKPNGAAAAALLSAAIGCLVLGLGTFGASASAGLGNALNWYAPVGPLAGKSGAATAAWFISWAVLQLLWKTREVRFGRVWTATLVLIGLSLLLTFPPLFEAVGPH